MNSSLPFNMSRALAFTLTIGLFVLCFFADSCKKHKEDRKVYTAPYPRNYTVKMGGTRHWTGTYEQGFFPQSVRNDTADFAITVLDDSTINIKGDTLYFRSGNRPDSSMLFVGPRAVAVNDTIALSYYFRADTLSYYKYSRPTLCCFDQYYLHAGK